MHQAQSDVNAIEDYSVSQSTLEQVFLSFGKLQSSQVVEPAVIAQRVSPAHFKPSMKNFLNLIFLGLPTLVPACSASLCVVSFDPCSVMLWRWACRNCVKCSMEYCLHSTDAIWPQPSKFPTFLSCNIDNSGDLQPFPWWFRLG